MSTLWIGDNPVRRDQEMKGDKIMTNEEFRTIVKIVERAEALGIAIGSRATRLLDIENAHEQFNLRLNDMLSGPNCDFSHDFIGIQREIDRNTGRITTLFVPRYAGRA